MKPAVFLYGVPGQYGNYAAALEAAGARVVLCRDLYRSLDCDGLLLPGGGDMESWRYGQKNTACRDLEPERDALELDLLADGCVALEAKEVEEMSDRQLQKMLPKISVIARSTPTVKMRVVKLLKARGDVVAVTGDGINDAPALKNADVGIAMGISGTEVSKEASDIVLLDDSFATIVKAVEWGRNIYENFKRFISFQLTVNIASVICVFVSVLMGLPAPFTALQLLWINIIMDGPPALTLGLEPGYSDLMRRRPTNRSENIISKGMLVRITATGVYMSVVFLLQYKLNFLGAARGEMATVLFTLFVLFQLFNAFNCRELHSESIFCHLFKNKLMLLVVGCTFVLPVCRCVLWHRTPGDHHVGQAVCSGILRYRPF